MLNNSKIEGIVDGALGIQARAGKKGLFKKARPARPQQAGRRIVLLYVESDREARTPLADVFNSPENMRGPGITQGVPGMGKAVYFRDPTGHMLEI